MFLHRYHFLGIILILWTITACKQVEQGVSEKLVIGVIGYGEINSSLDQYAELKDYLTIQLKTIVELEPAYNEIHALGQISQKKWDLVFADPGITALSVYRHQYQPIIALEGVDKLRSAIVVNQNSPIKDKLDLAKKSIALGQEGSATNYYLPIYNLYGLALKKVRFSPTPKTSLTWLEQEQVDAVALSLQEFNQHRQNFKPNQFRIIDLDSHIIPTGAIIIADHIDPDRSIAIQLALVRTPSHIAASAKFLPNTKVEQYDYLIGVIEKVIPIVDRIKQEPALFYEPQTSVAQ